MKCVQEMLDEFIYKKINVFVQIVTYPKLLYSYLVTPKK